MKNKYKNLNDKIEASLNVKPDYKALDEFIEKYHDKCIMMGEDFTPGIIKALNNTFENPVTLRTKYFLYLRGYRETLRCPVCGKILEKHISKTCGDNKCVQVLTEKTSLEKYGTRRPSQSQQIKDKAVEVCMTRYGVRNAGGSKESLEKIKKTSLERFGVDNYFKLKDEKGNYEVSNKFREKYGVDNYFQLKTGEGKQLAQVKFEEKYGVKVPQQLDHIKEKTKETCLERYGVDSYSKLPEATEARRNTYMSLYGVENNTQLHIKHLDILKDGAKLKKFIESHDYCITQLSKYFNVSIATLYKYIESYNLDVKIPVIGGISLKEKELLSYVESIYKGPIIENDRSILNGLELDIFLPEKRLAIEFNGNYWHSSLKHQKGYHLNKTKICEEKGIRLIHIFEYEWNNKRKNIENFLKDQIEISNKVYARNCSVKIIDSYEGFLSENHLQGPDKSKVKIGLFYNDNLVSVMTFTNPRFNKKYEWELSRYACLSGLRVIGGASKLYKFFVNNFNPQSVISYCDKSKSSGNLYKSLEFNYHGDSNPGYVWVNQTTVLSRYQTQAKRLHEKGYEGSEDDIMTSLGYFKIYDCGNSIWIWERNSIKQNKI